MFRRTQDPELRVSRFVYGIITLSDIASQLFRLRLTLVTQMFSPTTPTSKLVGLGFSRFARRYLGNRFFFLFLQLLRCFSSLRLPSTALTALDNTSRYWVPPFGYLRIIAYLLLPEAFRGSSRPSSASSA